MDMFLDSALQMKGCKGRGKPKKVLAESLRNNISKFDLFSLLALDRAT